MIEKPLFVLPAALTAIASGNQRTEAPASHLGQFTSPGLVWRSTGNSNLWARGQFNSTQPISFCTMLAANALAGTQIRLRLGTSQAEVDGAAPYDSAAQAFISPSVSRESGLYNSHLQFAEQSALWWRVDITGHTGDFSAMKLVMGKAIQPARYYNSGFEYGLEDLGAIDFSRWGVALETDGFIFRSVNFRLGWVSEAEFESAFRKVMNQSRRGPVLVCFDPQPNAYRQDKTYFGRFKQPPFAQAARKPGTYSMDFTVLSII